MRWITTVLSAAVVLATAAHNPVMASEVDVSACLTRGGDAADGAWVINENETRRRLGGHRGMPLACLWAGLRFHVNGSVSLASPNNEFAQECRNTIGDLTIAWSYQPNPLLGRAVLTLSSGVRSSVADVRCDDGVTPRLNLVPIDSSRPPRVWTIVYDWLPHD